MTNEDVFPHYRALWKRLPEDELYIHYTGPSVEGEAGFFQHDPPSIGICRPHYTDPDEPSTGRNDCVPVKLADEMLTLAHEYGHFLSFSGATRREIWNSYHRAVVRRDELVA